MESRTHRISAVLLGASVILVVVALMGVHSSAALNVSYSQRTRSAVNVAATGPQVWSEISTPDQGTDANA